MNEKDLIWIRFPFPGCKTTVKIEILKHLVRTEHELDIIDSRAYLRLSEQIIEISKMTNGWISYITQKEPSK